MAHRIEDPKKFSSEGWSSKSVFGMRTRMPCSAI